MKRVFAALVAAHSVRAATLLPRDKVINAGGPNHADEPFGAVLYARGKVLLLGPLLLLAGAAAWVLLMLAVTALLRSLPETRATRSSRDQAWEFLYARMGHLTAMGQAPQHSSALQGPTPAQLEKSYGRINTSSIPMMPMPWRPSMQATPPSLSPSRSTSRTKINPPTSYQPSPLSTSDDGSQGPAKDQDYRRPKLFSRLRQLQALRQKRTSSSSSLRSLSVGRGVNLTRNRSNQDHAHAPAAPAYASPSQYRAISAHPPYQPTAPP